MHARTHTHTEQEEKKIVEAQQDQIEFLQEKLSEIQAGDGEADPTGPGATTAGGTEGDTADGAHSEAPVIPPAPPPPPIDGVPMAPTFGIYYKSLYIIPISVKVLLYIVKLLTILHTQFLHHLQSEEVYLECQ